MLLQACNLGSDFGNSGNCAAPPVDVDQLVVPHKFLVVSCFDSFWIDSLCLLEILDCLDQIRTLV